MEAIIIDFIEQLRKKEGIIKPVTKQEIEMVENAFLAVKDLYFEKRDMIILKICCESLIQCEKEQKDSPINTMMDTVQAKIDSPEYYVLKQDLFSSSTKKEEKQEDKEIEKKVESVQKPVAKPVQKPVAKPVQKPVVRHIPDHRISERFGEETKPIQKTRAVIWK